MYFLQSVALASDSCVTDSAAAATDDDDPSSLVVTHDIRDHNIILIQINIDAKTNMHYVQNLHIPPTFFRVTGLL